MIITIMLILFSLYCHLKLSRFAFLTSIFIVFFCILAHVGYLLEVSFIGLNYFNSDELIYLNNNGLTEASMRDRKLWFIINQVVNSFDTFNGAAIKLFNISILLFINIFLYLIFRVKIIMLFPIFVPYSMYLATMNLRDLLVLFFIIFTTYFLTNKSKVMTSFALIGIVSLFYLRPFMGLLILACYLLLFLGDRVLKGKSSTKLLSAIFGVLVLCLVYILAQGKIETYLNTIQHIVESGERDLSLRHLIISIVTYIFTPIPSSMLERVIDGGSLTYGLTDDVFRTVNQFFYYFMIIYLVMHLKVVLSVVINATMRVKLLFFVLGMHAPIYAFYFGGGGHSRIKIPFILLIFILCVLVFENKKSKNIVNVRLKL